MILTCQNAGTITQCELRSPMILILLLCLFAVVSARLCGSNECNLVKVECADVPHRCPNAQNNVGNTASFLNWNDAKGACEDLNMELVAPSGNVLDRSQFI